jgi:hypothetical protein
MQFQATDACSSLGRTRVVNKTQLLSVVEKEVVYRIKSNILSLEKYIANVTMKIDVTVK